MNYNFKILKHYSFIISKVIDAEGPVSMFIGTICFLLCVSFDHHIINLIPYVMRLYLGNQYN